MSHATSWAPWIVWSLVLLAIAGGILAVGYLAYQTRKAREEARLEERAPGPDPADELAELNDEIEAKIVEARRSLEATRDAVRDGVRW